MPRQTKWKRSPALPRGFVLDRPDITDHLYLLPSGIIGGEAGAAAVISGHGWPLAGSDLVFTSVTVLFREDGKPESAETKNAVLSRDQTVWVSHAPFAALVDWANAQGRGIGEWVGRYVQRMGAKRQPWAGLSMASPHIMGILNTTPDSFSDGGAHLAADAAIQMGLKMAELGATILDVGGESTRPGAAPVSCEEEIRRTQPVIRALAQRGLVVSIDTRHAATMQAALAAGAQIINDVTALQGDPGSVQVAAGSDAALCLMHMQGEPGTMQNDPQYDCAALDVYDYLCGRIAICEQAGIDASRIAVDPGIGFGKSLSHNQEIFHTLALYHGTGCPILLGASRKRFIAETSCQEPPSQRLGGSLAAHLHGLSCGVQIVRVHDVAETAQAVRVWRYLRNGS